MSPAIRVENLSKCYRINHAAAGRENYKTLRESLAGAIQAPFKKWKSNGGGSPKNEDFWALKDVSFEVKPGEVVGIIGRNGAGKSTLLKILSRITKPTSGRVSLHGRVGSLLEVGTGFHPELTGRENVYLNGSILGMARKEIDRQFDAIVDFSGVEKFLDTPVKRYSSGMYVRLAFAVAAHLNPEILIVDEVLAVGDAEFQKKCLGKMGQVAHEGRTVLFVSHNMTAIMSLCGRAVWLDNGHVQFDGDPNATVTGYLQSWIIATNREWEDPKCAPGDNEVRLKRVAVNHANNELGAVITVESPVRVTIEFWNYIPGARLNVSVMVLTAEGVCVFSTGARPDILPAALIKNGFEIPGGLLNNGIHTLRVFIVRDEGTILFDLSDAAQFEVLDVDRKSAWHGKWLGATRPRIQWDPPLVSLL